MTASLPICWGDRTPWPSVSLSLLSPLSMRATAWNGIEKVASLSKNLVTPTWNSLSFQAQFWKKQWQNSSGIFPDIRRLQWTWTELSQRRAPRCQPPQLYLQPHAISKGGFLQVKQTLQTQVNVSAHGEATLTQAHNPPSLWYVHISFSSSPLPDQAPLPTSACIH